MASIARALRRIKRDPLGVLNRGVVERACRDHDHPWRERELDPTLTVALFAQQIIHGNTPCSEVRHMAGRSFTASAWCQAQGAAAAGGVSDDPDAGLRSSDAADARASAPVAWSSHVSCRRVDLLDAGHC